MPHSLDTLILGESDDIIQADGHEDIYNGILKLSQQCRRQLDIFSHTLERRIYNSEQLQQAILKLATRSRHSQIRIIVKNSNDMIRRGSRLVNLSHRLGSRIQFRIPPIEYRDYIEEFVIADNIGSVHRPIASRYEGSICFKQETQTRRLSKFFDECWSKSAGDPNLRRLDI